MKRVVATGKTVEEAITSGLVRLGASRSQATVRVITEPVKGLFGFIGGKDAEVEVSIPSTPEETAKDFLAGVLKRMGFDWRIKSRSVEEDEPGILLEIACDEESLPVIIGRHGSTLDSLQYLVNIVANHEQENHVRFYVDAGDYRRRRKEHLHRLAERAAERAVRTKRQVPLDAMPAPDRKVIHTYLQERTDVTTSSEGVEPNRKVVVVPASLSVSRPRRQRRPERSERERSERDRTERSERLQ
ncbi:protein jag [Alicyclobacillus tolerans]|uniref:RNA-binding cell elongation regulator Jag/EloR n=1 Tax=Alicyclobacillus tolerans TaxID=90970 RepID=UPI001F31DE01|nr:RNA-binding cell elongation regulator Jag/EloR [Alicyclobacillus tolerans]MCF8565708.1 protein jag [Alicyclobacillus tolerans]